MKKLSRDDVHTVRVSSPGRICLFGEHQDYLQLPVIPCALSLRIEIDGSRRTDMNVCLDLPDIGRREQFSLVEPLAYIHQRDYFRSTVNVLRRHGFTFASGFDCRVRGTIPINAGTSSSSALIVSWVHFLTRMSEQRQVPPPPAIAALAHEAEVVEFGEPGGMMDHYAAACGGLFYLAFSPAVSISELPAQLGTLVLGNSGEPKDTTSILARVKNRVLDAVAHLSRTHPGFLLRNETPDSIDSLSGTLSGDQVELLRGTVRNHQITRTALVLLQNVRVDHRQLGVLLSEHQQVLRDVLRISTPKIDRMLAAAVDAGAAGGKINGSGGGGCMFAYAPDHPERVAAAIEKAGGTAYIVRPDSGTRVEEGKGME
jgi:galactokinase